MSHANDAVADILFLFSSSLYCKLPNVLVLMPKRVYFHMLNVMSKMNLALAICIRR